MYCRGIRVIGLTGGVATGKSTVAGFITERGGVVIDADEISREVVMPGGAVITRIVDAFGREILQQDGTLDRNLLGKMVFADAAKRHILEQIIHPEIRHRAEASIDKAAKEGHRLVFYMAPLLIEAGATGRVDEIWVVTVRPEIQFERLMLRNGINRDEAGLIIASQMPLCEKERYGKS